MAKQQPQPIDLHYIWANKKRLVLLEWVHPEWLRATILMLVAAPVFLIVVFGVSAVVLLVPLVILVKFLGFAWGFVIWVVLYIYAFRHFGKWSRKQTKRRPRRSKHRYN